jgi:hypothetical protein
MIYSLAPQYVMYGSQNYLIEVGTILCLHFEEQVLIFMVSILTHHVHFNIAKTGFPFRMSVYIIF